MDFKPTTRGVPVGATLLAAIFTLAIFILLPSLESMRDKPDRELELRTVDTVALEPPSPPEEPPEPPPEKESEQPETPKPKLRKPERSMPLSAMLDFDFGKESIQGDFSFDFDISASPAAGMEDGVFELSEIDKNPTPIVRTAPIYPIQAKMRRVEGMVVLEFVVDKEGRARDIEVSRSEPDDIFVDSAKKAVRNWRFKPGIKDGEPVEVRVQQKLTFNLDQ